MNTAQIKLELFRQIDNLEENKLSQLYNYLVKKTNKSVDFWNELSTAQQADVEKQYQANGIYALNPSTKPNWRQNNLTPDGNFEVVKNAKVILHSGDVVNGGGIALMPGVNVLPGGEMDVFIDQYPCGADPAWRMANNNNGGANALQAQSLQLAPNVVSAKKVSGIKVYPNPSSGNISIERESEEPTSIVISDLNGKIVYTGTIGGGLNSIDLSSLQNGAYMLQAGADKFKLMIVK